MKEEEKEIEESQCAWDQIKRINKNKNKRRKEKWEKKKKEVRVDAPFLVVCF
jgi:hypothetical protein